MPYAAIMSRLAKPEPGAVATGFLCALVVGLSVLMLVLLYLPVA